MKGFHELSFELQQILQLADNVEAGDSQPSYLMDKVKE